MRLLIRSDKFDFVLFFIIRLSTGDFVAFLGENR